MLPGGHRATGEWTQSEPERRRRRRAGRLSNSAEPQNCVCYGSFGAFALNDGHDDGRRDLGWRI